MTTLHHLPVEGHGGRWHVAYESVQMPGEYIAVLQCPTYLIALIEGERINAQRAEQLLQMRRWSERHR